MKDKKVTTLIFCIGTLLLAFIFYFHTIFYPVKGYDELVPFKETHMPVCFSISQMLELISILGFSQHFEAANTLYSNIVSLRCDPVSAFLHMSVQLLFQKNCLLYRLYGLILHLINTLLVYFIIKKISSFFITEKTMPVILTTSILTMLWAIHPVNIESVLLLTNANIIIGYSFSFLVCLIYLNLISSNSNLLKQFLMFVIFLFALFTAEFHFMLPLILIAYTIAFNMNQKSNSSLHSLISSVKLSLPLLLATSIFIITFLLSNTKINVTSQTSLIIILERIFWLAPQIIFHLLSLLLFPIKLSVDQSLLVTLGKSIFDPYAVFCFFFIVMLLIISFISYIFGQTHGSVFGQTHGSAPTFANAKKKFPFLFIIIFPVLLSLVPFSHILAPVYNLASERYLYLPSFFFLFGIAHFVFHVLSNVQQSKGVQQHVPTIILILILVLYGTRSYIRTLDWKDTISLYKSAINTTHDPLAKAFRYRGLTPQDKTFADYPEREVDLKYQKLAILNLKKAISGLKAQKEKYQLNIPLIVKFYGLDPETLLAKAGYILAQADFALSNDTKRTLQIIRPYFTNLDLLDSAALSFYSSLLFYNESIDEAEKVLRNAYKKFPYSTRIILPLCDVIYAKYGSLDEVEKNLLQAFKYFPYDKFTLYSLAKTYEMKNDHKEYAFFSYILGLRTRSPNELENAAKVYTAIKDFTMADKARKWIKELKEKDEI